MKKKFSALCFIFLISALSFLPAAAQKKDADARSQTILFIKTKEMLSAYSHKDTAALINLFDEKNALMMGADISETATTRVGIGKLLTADFALWDSSAFGEPQNYHALVLSKQAASVFFDVPWQASSNGATRKFTIRLAMVWRKNANGDWKIVQLLNAVPTHGQSATEIKRQTQN